MEEIAEELEENLEQIQSITEIAASYAPGYDCDKICDEYGKVLEAVNAEEIK